MKKKLLENLLFEIGVEEIPSDYIEGALESIQKKTPVLFEACGYQYEELVVRATPRRFVIFAKNFSKKPQMTEERLGPSKEQSYHNNVPTPALIGFLKSIGKKESDIEWKEMAKGVRAKVTIKKEAKPLRHFFETLPLEMEFPKLMRWESSFTFARPIRWMFAVVGKKFEHFQIDSSKSDSYTYGHRFLANRKIRIASADLDLYEKILQKNHVVLNHKKRVRLIREFLKLSNNSDENLIQKVANLVEEPYPVRGTFKKDYLVLPAEVLSTCMRQHQKIFACYDAQGKLVNRFIAIMNGKRSHVKLIARNYENVLKSRLEDAKFFYHEDTKTKLEAKVPKLKEMVFLGKLGSYFEKVERLQKLVEYLAKSIQGAAWFSGNASQSQYVVQDALKTARLCKADLMTHLVYEFPELQGIAGSEYAKHDGENEPVWKGIKEHYYPLNLSEGYAQLVKKMNPPAVLVSLADRMDLLIGAIGMGIEPSGSRDPYALRRAAGGFVKIVRAFHLPFSFGLLIRKTVELYGHYLKANANDIHKKLIPFVKERMIFELDLKPGTKPYEIFQAVFDSGLDDLSNVYDRFFALIHLYEKKPDEFMKACKVVERTSNILKGVKEISGEIDGSALQVEEEKTLYQLVCAKEPEIARLLSRKEYGTASEEYSRLFYKPVHDFFDKVLVNDQDQKIRANRQALVQKINRLYTDKIANLALITNQ